MEQPLFGDTLRTLMRAQEIPIRGLARAIHVEKSVVYRWLRNERVPQLNTDHVANIEKYLALDPRAADQLRRAQITSLTQARPSAPPRKRASRSTALAVDRLIGRAREGSGSLPAKHLSAMPRAFVHAQQAATLRGGGAVLQTAIDIIESARPAPQGENPTILLSVQGEELFGGPQGLEQAWQHSLRAALRRGWKIEQLWRLDKDVSRSLRLVDSMLDLIGLGGYHPRYFERYGLLQPPYDLVIVPGHAAMLVLAADGSACSDGALVLTEPSQVDLASAHYRHLRAHTKWLLQGFMPKTQELDYTRALVEAEAKAGGRLFVMDAPSALTLPLSWLREDSTFGRYAALSGMVHESDLRSYMQELRRRAAEFERLVKSYDYLDICPLRSIRQLAEMGRYHPDTALHGKHVPLKMRLEHLQRIVSMLSSHERYSLALLDEREEEAMPTVPTRIMAGENDAFVVTLSRDVSDRPTTVPVHISEPTIVAAFREHFADMWERIAPPHKQKSDVIQWLQRQVDLLQHHMQVEGRA